MNENLPAEVVRNRLILFGAFVAFLTFVAIFRRRFYAGPDSLTRGPRGCQLYPFGIAFASFPLLLAFSFSRYNLHPAKSSGITLGEILSIAAVALFLYIVGWFA